MKKTRLEKLLEDKDIAVVEAIVAHLRLRLPRLVPTEEISYIIRRSTDQTYGLIKKGRELLKLTTGEFIPNVAKRKGKALHGYTVNNSNRAGLFEETKSYDRADGHIQSGLSIRQRLPRDRMQTPEDIELWLANQARARAGELFLKAGEDARQVTALKPNNDRLSLSSRSETITPWETLGLENHRADDDDDFGGSHE